MSQFVERPLPGPSRLTREVLLAVAELLHNHPPRRMQDGSVVWSDGAVDALDKRLRDRVLALHSAYASDLQQRDVVRAMIHNMVAMGLTHTEIHVSLSMLKARVALGYSQVDWHGPAPEQPPD